MSSPSRLYVVGRKSGRHYTVPVAHTRHDGILLIGTPFAWGRNLHTGEPVDIRFKGKRRPADVHVLIDEAGVVEHYAAMARDNHNFAKFNQIGFDQTGNPNPADLHLAWAAGARVFRLTPRRCKDHRRGPGVAAGTAARRPRGVCSGLGPPTWW